MGSWKEGELTQVRKQRPLLEKNDRRTCWGYLAGLLVPKKGFHAEGGFQ
jgi:hypothetical protein